MHDTPRPHDLLWGMRPEQLPIDAPAWAIAVLSAGHPVVVRRARTAPGLVAVGLRGASREQRLAALMPVEAIRRRVTPEALGACETADDLPAIQALRRLRSPLDACGHAWGVTGSVGFQLASGLPVATSASDLDLLLRVPQPLSISAARALCERLDDASCRVDMQLETPFGAVALREWASGATRVMLKADDGPRLLRDPWQAPEQAA